MIMGLQLYLLSVEEAHDDDVGELTSVKSLQKDVGQEAAEEVGGVIRR